MASEIQALRAEVARLSESASNRAYAEMEHAGAKVKETVHDLARRGSDLASNARATLDEKSSELEEQIARNPWPAVLIAGGIGLVMGMMSRRSD
jgi:ElaB/YqjD/DUF883 family membrane-anchored ribosome-binding protein